jgi:hypothetical protein
LLNPAPAINRVPSAEEATVSHSASGALVCVQFVPESAETKIGPPPPWLSV